MDSATVECGNVSSTTPPTTNNSSPTIQAAQEMPPSPSKSSTGEPTSMLNLKKFIPVSACFMAFAIVMTILIIYMDNNEIVAMQHYRFRMNMSQDYDLYGVTQDNPQLVTYIREVHIAPAMEPHHKPLVSDEGVPEDTAYVVQFLQNKKDGVFVEAGAYSDGKTSKTEYLERKLNWRGLLIQPDPRHYFNLRRHNRIRSQAIHACLSPMPYPKEVTLHQDGDGVKINSIHSNSLDDPDWFNTRVKCFPLFSLLLAMNVTSVDYFSLEAGGNELQVLETVPFERVHIEVIGVHLLTGDGEKDTIRKFLVMKQYKFVQSFNTTYIFVLNRGKI